MRYLLQLSQDNLKLAEYEALSLLKPKKSRLEKNMLMIEVDDISLSERLAYTKAVYELLFDCDINDAVGQVKKFVWEQIYESNFRVRVHNKGKLQEKEIASLIWKSLKDPKVNLANPKTSLEFFIIGRKVYSTRLHVKLNHCFEERKAHKKPELHPTALSPKLARALINLAGAQKSVMDPFCGAGGILVEAGLIGLKPIGYDLYNLMLKKAKANLDFFKIRPYKLINKDALKIKERYDYVATDMPYGLNSSIWISKGKNNQRISVKENTKAEKKRRLEDFYLKFLKNLRKVCKKKAVVIFPNYVSYRRIISESGFKKEKEFSQFVHGSLTRKIVVLS
ncbi:MAG TPA: DNA methyltransferase [Candidatus Nanoarchaeia archaeon]|nr:DNA methyltransferase [Candidatus Nanoarchaeia archaeon]